MKSQQRKCNRPEVRNYFVDYEPPLDYARHLRGVIDQVEPESVKGLSLVLLRNSGSVRRREAQWKKPGGVGPREVQGVYYRAWKEPARIELFVDKTLVEWPEWRKLDDGRTVVLRTKDPDKITLEIQDGRKRIKIRYQAE